MSASLPEMLLSTAAELALLVRNASEAAKEGVPALKLKRRWVLHGWHGKGRGSSYLQWLSITPPRKLQKASKDLKRARVAAVQRFFKAFVSKLKTCIQGGDQLSFYKHLKGMEM